MRVTASIVDSFSGMEPAWTDVLATSAADRLFMSWQWLSTWWSVFGGGNAELRLYEIFDHEGRHLGIAPCWLSREWVKRVIPVRRLQFVGNRWRSESVAISEYSDVIAARDRHAEVVSTFLEHADEARDWDELVLVAMRADSPSFALMRDFAETQGWLLRIEDRTVSYRVSLADGFDGFLSRLSSPVRRQVFNKRQRLRGQSATRIEANDPASLERSFETLNSFHVRRWGRPAFAGPRLEFQRRICRQALRSGALRFEVLNLDDQPLSIVFDLLTSTTEYNIQMGFDAERIRGLSPGLMHLGCAIESAASSGKAWFDLLAGAGRSSDYKRSLADERIELITVQLVRAKWLAALYRLWDRNRAPPASALSS